MNLKEFINECRERKVLRTVTLYAVISWLLIQVAATTFPYIGLPKEAVSLVIILLLLGFPLAITLSWFYNVEQDPVDAIPLRPPSEN